MNGMRPRGVIVYSGRVDDDGVFHGAQEMRGVRMQFPPGYTPTTWHVELRREEGRAEGEPG